MDSEKIMLKRLERDSQPTRTCMAEDIKHLLNQIDKIIRIQEVIVKTICHSSHSSIIKVE